MMVAETLCAAAAHNSAPLSSTFCEHLAPKVDETTPTVVLMRGCSHKEGGVGAGGGGVD